MRPSLRVLSASLLAATMGMSIFGRPNEAVAFAGQRTRGSNIGRDKWTRHCWRPHAVTALAAGPVAQGTVPPKSSWTRRLH
jgi:hypothetical protein